MHSGRLNLKKFSLLFVSIVAFAAASGQTIAPLPPPRHQFTVVCHRGDHTHAPENTLAAFANAIKAGADYVEIDLRTTVDSQLVIMHDATVNRMTTGTGLIKDMRYDSLSKLRVKDKTHPNGGNIRSRSSVRYWNCARTKYISISTLKMPTRAPHTGLSGSMGWKNRSSFTSTRNRSFMAGAAWPRQCRSWSVCREA
jgi:hypothetical protein